MTLVVIYTLLILIRRYLVQRQLKLSIDELDNEESEDKKEKN